MNNGKSGAGGVMLTPDHTQTSPLANQSVPLPLGVGLMQDSLRDGSAKGVGPASSGSAAAPSLRPVDAFANAAPLTYAQRRWWLLEELEPGVAIPCVGARLRLQGSLDSDALEAALSAIVDRQDILRSAFSVVAGQPVQVATKKGAFRLARTDLAAIDAETRDRILDRLAREDAAQPFDLRGDILMRARLVRLERDEHALQVVFHPVAADSASLAVFVRDLDSYYTAFAAGAVPLLPDLPERYVDHATRERQSLAGERMRVAAHFWRENLAGAPAVLALPTDRVRPSAQTRRADVCGAHLPSALVADVRRFASTECVSTEAVLLAAFQAVLQRYSAQEDLIVGVADIARLNGGNQALIGCFENTLPLRSRLRGEQSFREIVRAVEHGLCAARAHGDLPYDRLLEELSLAREASHEPLCQVKFSMIEPASMHPRIGELGTRMEPLFTGAMVGDLAFHVRASGQEWLLAAEYSQDLFDAETVDRLLGHVRTLLESGIAEPGQTLARLPLLSLEEYTRLVHGWNATETVFPHDRLVHHLFEDQVARTPDATALVFNDHAITYSELNRRANGIAARLTAAGIGRDCLVALCADRSIEMVIGLYGILKAGAAYVPLDPTFPADRLGFMLDDSGASVLVTQKRLETLFVDRNVAILLLDEQPPPTASRSPFEARSGDAAPTPDSLAYVLYTSGSTGKPKGVMISHRNVVNFFTAMDAVVGAEPGVWLAVTSISFDISVLELFWTLTRGFKVVLLADQAGMKVGKPSGAISVEGREATRSLDEQLANHDITHLQCTPSFARLLTRLPETLARLRPLRRMLIGGEGLPADLAQTLVSALDGKLVNMYGPTETTVWSTTHVVESVRSGVVDIGRPVANTAVYILDAHRQPVPIGVPGELYIAGDGVARGYWRRAELTEERFVANPFKMGGGRMYRTGDLARYRSDGVIEFIGRADHQVKVRGHRIELGEIEAVLAQHPAIAQSVVVVRTDNPDDPRLAAYLVPHVVVEAPDASALKQFVREKLPAHMVPEFFVALGRLPLTPNGKIDRKALPPPPKPAQAASTPGEGRLLVSTQKIEHAISAIWREILDVDRLDEDDNFFDSGGRSLHVVEVKTRLQESLGVEVPVIRLFQYPTIRSLAGFIGSQTKAPPADSLPSQTQERTRKRFTATVGMSATMGDTK